MRISRRRPPGRYTIIRRLGTGGFGHVLLADDPKLRRRVAIKIPCQDRVRTQRVHFLELDRLRSVAEKQFAEHTSAEVHSAAEWLLRQHKSPIPNLIESPAAADWFLTNLKSGEIVTFLSVKPQIVPVGAGLTSQEQRMFQPRQDEFLQHEFFMSAKQISASLILRFVESLDFEDPARKHFSQHPQYQQPDKDSPAINLNWIDAVRFCNWLSEQEGRQPRNGNPVIIFVQFIAPTVAELAPCLFPTLSMASHRLAFRSSSTLISSNPPSRTMKTSSGLTLDRV